ncbi:30S ribosomal protein S20 [Halanaerobium congolense]|jgi:small subunit ribosomal protein S20|uniref:Small ribosomal subunit protein bS20 n=1 Tax=Halanaerobium congolense TaxID=54121 RepID=A0A1M7MI30_9FIRM|nr:30S ribosomal protein S20 [Halanaerobium congolense]KXS50519.1 MAG: small subunit ribosomal protein S20 [Halanaerobium sp. T82-1]OEG62621.1 MAG: 30S ribosomal protein S20 [Halanaerobium sp. MDAL1]PUU92762.1 MAG: small subunit ribosomal protein S20 [Halanaerobium sp.]PTX16770.1 small subunit ribosomal protein S20 [Halanaerobium congolense]PXV66423.1 small subunit ribosomal protein S20 [Halanaerobium congolense]
MPIIKSAKKRVKTTEKKTAQNRMWKDRLKNAIKDMEKAVEAGDNEAAAEQLKETKKVIDKAVTRNIIHKNNAARKKSRLTKMYNNM